MRLKYHFKDVVVVSKTIFLNFGPQTFAEMIPNLISIFLQTDFKRQHIIAIHSQNVQDLRSSFAGLVRRVAHLPPPHFLVEISFRSPFVELPTGWFLFSPDGSRSKPMETHKSYQCHATMPWRWMGGDKTKHLVPSAGQIKQSVEVGKVIPKDPCREYLPTFPLECGHFSPNVGK